MANIRQIKRRIRSVSNTAKITRAMEMVAASKMRRVQQRALAARPYAERIRTVLADLASRRVPGEQVHPLLEVRPVVRTLYLHVTPDRGLCGGLVANMNRKTAALLLADESEKSLVCVGRKGRDFFARAGYPMVAEFTNLGDYPEMLQTLPISRILMEEYRTGAVGRVLVVYPHFVNTAVQTPTVLPILPIQPPSNEGMKPLDYIYEPSPEQVFSELLPRYLEMQVYDAIVESIASEQSARMVAMRAATDAANEMIQDLTLTYNKARQEQITKELLDIVGGVTGVAKA